MTRSGAWVLALVVVQAIACGVGGQEDLSGRPTDLEATETSPNDLSFETLMSASDEELMAELERRKAELARKTSEQLLDGDAPPEIEESVVLEEIVPAYAQNGTCFRDNDASPGPVKDFVRVYDGEFVVVSNTSGVAMCKPFFLTGWNSWDVTRVPRIQSYRSMNGQRALTQQLQTASQSGLNVLRAWAHTIDPSYPVMKAPGEYDEEGLKAIDYLLSEASKYGIRVVLSFVDNWKYPGGVDQMLDWSATAPEREIPVPGSLLGGGDYNQDNLEQEVKEYIVRRHSLFYTDEGARDIYRDYVRTLVNRKNAYNGRVYKEDPTILAWNLINEPRCESWLVEDCEEKLQAWIESESAYVKEQDPNHLVTVGEEGFWSAASPNEYANPTWWAKGMGQDFKLNHMPKDIDFATIHIWPDTWERPEESFQRSWILTHMREAEEELGKPLVLEEFGKSIKSYEDGIEARNQVYRSAHELVEESVRKNRGLKGSCFWNWETDLIRSPGSYEINNGDSTFELVKEHARRMNEMSAQKCSFRCEV
ncbi:glycoside hydrolase [Chloropicon primus]|uniref:mannan endo-1,4-beta-mannosidase n=1 Tax=Chloropicon primus TaxID=1764295 RepID=A0A5B8MTR3_9CHLO|nr:glycoside hydrolase [Chloropicon primus]UPR03104.1 glycoside hydrolase [Chloropicon primus]|eukprot:QDZ23893.1 glycoside hydrolase [Chloropicon primus]